MRCASDMIDPQVDWRTSTSLASLANVSHSVAEGESTRQLFHNVNVHIYAGSLTAIMGPSGSGKSTLLSILGGLVTPTSGSMTANGIDVAGLDETARCRFRREHIGFVFQDIRLLPQLNAFDNVMMPAWFRYRDADAARHAADKALTAVGMIHLARAMPARMSGGEKQRVALARVLACDPPLILADEPTAALDWASAEVFLNLLHERVSGTNKAAVLVTHDPRVIGWVQHIYHLEKSGLRSEGKT
jgi:putative ABC transport system ATP-binding protein